jgi:Family of unknown function (DUF6600)
MRTKIAFAKNIRLGLGLAALLSLPACYVDDPPPYYGDADYGPPVDAGAYDIAVRSDGDFYGPLSAYGTWESVGAYGQCWVPAGVGPGWQPYENGEWISTDDGWYWDSDEPWGWATYHYGRWVDAPAVGWCWIPGTQWGPAWVAWCESGDVIGWAPLPPAGGFFRGGFRWRRDDDDRRHFVFVHRRDFQRPICPADEDRFRAEVVAHLEPTTRFAVTREGPSRTVIERASGRPVQTLPARDLRRRTDAAVVSSWRRPEPGRVLEPGRPERREDSRRSATGGPATMGRPVPAAMVPPRAAPPPVRAVMPPRAGRRFETAPVRAPRFVGRPPPVEAAPRPPPPPPAARVAPPRPPAPPPAAHRAPPRRDHRDDRDHRDEQR